MILRLISIPICYYRYNERFNYHQIGSEISTTAGPGKRQLIAMHQEVRENLDAEGKKINRPRPYFSLSGKITEETWR